MSAIPQDTTTERHSYTSYTNGNKKSQFWRNLASPRRERPAGPTAAASAGRFRPTLFSAAARGQRSESRSRRRSLSRSRRSNAATTTATAAAAVDPSTRLGISPTHYYVPHDVSSKLTPPACCLLAPGEQEVVFFDEQAAAAAHDESNHSRSSSLFDSAWEEDSCCVVVDVPPPPPDFDSSSEKSNSTSSSKRSNEVPEATKTITTTPLGGHNSNLTIAASSSMNFATATSTKAPRFGAVVGLPRFGRGGGRDGNNNKSDTTKRRAKEIVQMARDKENSNAQKSSSSSDKPDSQSKYSSVTIFLLLLQPDSKLFELIQLKYPRKTTTVSDLLQMIPNNATERALAHQAYIGITRPHRRAPIVSNLQWLASNSVDTAQPSANIVPGEIILAIPAHAASKKIVSLSKQILANARIQKLMQQQSEQSTTTPQKSKHRSSKKKSARRSSTPRRSVAGNDDDIAGTTTTRTTGSSVTSATTSIISKSSSTTIPVLEAAQPVGIVTPPDSDRSSFRDHHGSEGLQGAFATAATVSPAPTKNRVVSPSSSSPQQQGEIDFPVGGDMLHAFLSQDALARMCRVQHPNDDNNSTDNNSLDRDHLSACGDDCDGDSVDGSLTSVSLQSWTNLHNTSSHSLNSSLASKYAALTLEEEIAALQQKARMRQKRWARQIRTLQRGAGLLWVASVVRYCVDPNGYRAAATRQDALQEPLGWWGLGVLLLTFLCCLKFQRFFQKLAIRQSRCPVLQWWVQLYESRSTATPLEENNEDEMALVGFDTHIS